MVARSVKQRGEVDTSRRQEAHLDAFFAGVDEVRAFLDRSIQDPERRRARLSNIAALLLKPREARVLVEWLAGQLAAALGARAVAVFVCPATQISPACWCSVGSPHGRPQEVAELLAQRSVGVQLLVRPPGMLLPLAGGERIVGAVWFEVDEPLDRGSQALLQALGGAAGMALEQALALEAISGG